MKLGLILISVLAGLFPPPQDKPPTVSTLVQRFESRYRSSKTLQANFLETYFDSGKMVRSEAGIAYFGKPGKMRWEYKLHSPSHAGLMTTAGGLVFGSNSSSFFALDAAKGDLLWRFETGGNIDANPISYTSDGKQYVVIPSGHALLVFGLE